MDTVQQKESQRAFKRQTQNDNKETKNLVFSKFIYMQSLR